MSTPIYDKLKEYRSSRRISFAMPGHKNGRGLKNDLFQLDVTELDGTINLRNQNDEAVFSAQKKLSKLYGSDKSYIITCGSTAGIQAMISSVLKPGDTLLTGADCHMSVINTCALCGYSVMLIPASLDGENLIPHDDADLEYIIERHTDISAVLITSPNYYGQCREIERYARICHKYRLPLLVDEAHGAHFAASDKLPAPAIRRGADMAVNSAHKTLDALTGAAYLHINRGYVSSERVENALMAFQTSSPSYPIAASADIAREKIEHGGGWDDLIELCVRFREKVSEEIYLRVVDNDDPSRIVINLMSYDTTGFEVLKRLSDEFGIDAEMADAINVVFIATPSNTREDFAALFGALKNISDSLSVRHTPYKVLNPPVSERYINPQRAFYSSSEAIDPVYGIGRICAETITAYPPGIPIICAGEKITASHTLYLKHLKNIGAVFTNYNGRTINVVH